MQKIAIIADDLTGASDSGVQLTRKGFPTQVVFDAESLAKGADGYPVVIDTDSRGLDAEQAYEQVKKASILLKQAGYASIYKKVDSTLRGNLGKEIDAVLDVFSFACAIVVPAYPKIGRTTVNGIHYLNGVRIDQTEVARDPKKPVKESDLVKLLAAQSSRSVDRVDIELIRQGSFSIIGRIKELLSKGTELIVIDAETENDLEKLAHAVADSQVSALWVGSAGLADYLPVLVHTPSGIVQEVRIERTGEPVLLVAGSLSAVTREQVEAYSRQPNVTAVQMNPLEVIGSPNGRQNETERCKMIVERALLEKRDIALFVDSSPDLVSQTRAWGANAGLSGTQISDLIADSLGQVSAQVLANHKLQGMIMTGGDTAKAVCRQIGVTALFLVKEIEPGIPMSRLVGGYPILAVTKAGAFGKKDSLVHVLHALKGELSNE